MRRFGGAIVLSLIIISSFGMFKGEIESGNQENSNNGVELTVLKQNAGGNGGLKYLYPALVLGVWILAGTMVTSKLKKRNFI